MNIKLQIRRDICEKGNVHEKKYNLIITPI